MPYYSRGDDDQVDAFDEYDPTPYGGGFDLAMTYGRPIPPSDETCYPRSAPVDEDIEYENPEFSAIHDPMAYGDEAVDAEYSSYFRRKPRPGPSYGGEYGGGAEVEYGSGGYGRRPEQEEYGSGYRRRPDYEAPESEYESGYARRPEPGYGGYGGRAESGYGYGGRTEPEYESGYRGRSEVEYGSGYGRNQSYGDERRSEYPPPGYGGRSEYERPSHGEDYERPSYGEGYERPSYGEGYERPSYGRRNDDEDDYERRRYRYGGDEEGHGRKTYGYDE